MMITPTGITISFAGTRGGEDDSRPVVARIVGFDQASQAQPIVREMVVPAGQSVEEKLPHGLYNVQLTLPTGRIIQRNVTIAEDTNESFRFFEDFAPGSGFSLQEASGRDDKTRLAKAATASGNTSEREYFSALRRSLDEEREFRSRPSVAYKVDPKNPPKPPEEPAPRPARPSHASVAVEVGLDPSDWGAQPAAGQATPLEPAETFGDSALWRIAHDDPAPPTRATRRWARIALPDGRVELASLPLPWFCSASNTHAPAEVLVDPAREGGAATTVAVRDTRLAGLLAYLDRGQAGAARPMLKELERDDLIRGTIFEKMVNPLAACAAAYVGLAVYDPAEREQWDQWLGNCMSRFPDIPDAAIVHARRLVLRPADGADNDRAAAALRLAMAAGVPFFSAGVLLLREMLLQLCADHADLETLADKAGRIAGRVDPGQVFTVLRYSVPRSGK